MHEANVCSGMPRHCIPAAARAKPLASPLQPNEAAMADAPSKPVWFITGCSTGFGRELSVILLQRGYRVVVTARDKAKVDDIVGGHARTGLALELDVDKQDQIDAAVKAAVQKFGRIDVLVNNAGYGYLAAVEEGDDADVRAMFDTNFFGLAAMTRAALPVMRAQKSGAIVNVSSIGGFIGFPGSGYYAATKFAVEGLSEALSKEVAPLGIKVVIVEPGPFRTDWAGRSLKTPRKPIDAYAETAIARRKQIQGISGVQAGDPVRASEAIIAAAEQERPPLRLPLGAVAYEAMGAEIEAVRKEHASLEAAARGADYPKAG
jgi:NAD(P)-dependent dehydrogenase (short-subunit alcohol dehydrogenase family)